MKASHVLGLSLIAVAASLVLPSIVPAQDVAERQVPVRVTLLENGEIQVTGEFVLETEGLTSMLGANMTVDGQSVEIRNGLTIEAEDFVLRSDAARFLRGAPELHMQGATITPRRQQ